MKPPTLSLIVLRTAKLDPLLAFYRALGMEFVQEQHGVGPVHYSCQLGCTVLEIYPGVDGAAPPRQNGGATMLGFRVVSLDASLAALTQLGAQVVTPPRDSPWGRRAVVMDLDGRAVELTQ
jgi:lactoylglutathione lyase